MSISGEMLSFLNSTSFDTSTFPVAEMERAFTGSEKDAAFLNEVANEFERAVSVAQERNIRSFPVIPIASQLQSFAGYAVAYSAEEDPEKKKIIAISALQCIRSIWQMSTSVTVGR